MVAMEEGKIHGSHHAVFWKLCVDWVRIFFRFSMRFIWIFFCLGINIHLHVTPYQVQDDHRPCKLNLGNFSTYIITITNKFFNFYLLGIRKEEKAFTDLLKRLGCTLTRHLHVSESNVSNLFTHFEVLENFRKHQINMQQQQPETNSQVIQKTPHLGALDNCSKKSSSSSSSSSDGSNNEDELEKPEIKWRKDSTDLASWAELFQQFMDARSKSRLICKILRKDKWDLGDLYTKNSILKYKFYHPSDFNKKFNFPFSISKLLKLIKILKELPFKANRNKQFFIL